MNGPAARATLLWLMMLVTAVPVVGQDDGPRRLPDVHFVPTQPAVVSAMLSTAKVTKNDLVYDLGCGDGRIVIAAVKRYGARGVCVDIDPERIAESRRNARQAGVARRITFIEGDLFELDLSKASVVTLYLLSTLNERLRPKLFRELRPGSRVVSNAFDMGEWKTDSLLEVPPDEQFPSYAYYWVIPADVAGTWKIQVGGTATSASGGSDEYELRLQQRYQELTATGSAGGRPVSVSEVKIVGDRLSFTVSDSLGQRPRTLRFSGRVTDDEATGSVTEGAGRKSSWTGERTERGARPELREPEQP